MPHSSSLPPKVGEDLILISELDQIAKIAFQGMKSLNRIQSVVFDTAYYTSENMLISAPTGAGKTNIAMLAVLREIKQNIEGEVIKRDQFKVCLSVTCKTFLHSHIHLALTLTHPLTHSHSTTRSTHLLSQLLPPFLTHSLTHSLTHNTLSPVPLS